jgi:CHAD domain-containing protein
MLPGIPKATHAFNGLLRQRWRAYSAALDAVRRRPTRKAIHDFRVATRRLLAIVRLARGIAPDCKPSWFEARLQAPFRAAGRIRDTQLAVDQLDALRARHPCARGLRTGLLRRLPRLKRRLKRRLAQLRARPLRKRLRRLRDAASRRGASRTGAALLQRLQRANLARARRAVRTAMAGSSQPSAAALHALRVAIKNLRYMSEAAERIRLVARRDTSSSFEAWQRSLGGIADRRALLELLDSVPVDAATDRTDLQSLRRGVQATQRRQIGRLAQLGTLRTR